MSICMATSWQIAKITADLGTKADADQKIALANKERVVTAAAEKQQAAAVAAASKQTADKLTAKHSAEMADALRQAASKAAAKVQPIPATGKSVRLPGANSAGLSQEAAALSEQKAALERTAQAQQQQVGCSQRHNRLSTP